MAARKLAGRRPLYFTEVCFCPLYFFLYYFCRLMSEISGPIVTNFATCSPMTVMYTRKLRYRKHDRAMRPIYGCPKKFLQSWLANGYFPEICNGLLFRSILIMYKTMRTKLEVRSFTRSWDNRGVLKKCRSPWIRPRSLFSQILMGFCSHGRCEYAR